VCKSDDHYNLCWRIRIIACRIRLRNVSYAQAAWLIRTNWLQRGECQLVAGFLRAAFFFGATGGQSQLCT